MFQKKTYKTAVYPPQAGRGEGHHFNHFAADGNAVLPQALPKNPNSPPSGSSKRKTKAVALGQASNGAGSKGRATYKQKAPSSTWAQTRYEPKRQEGQRAAEPKKSTENATSEAQLLEAQGSGTD